MGGRCCRDEIGGHSEMTGRVRAVTGQAVFRILSCPARLVKHRMSPLDGSKNIYFSAPGTCREHLRLSRRPFFARAIPLLPAHQGLTHRSGSTLAADLPKGAAMTFSTKGAHADVDVDVDVCCRGGSPSLLMVSPVWKLKLCFAAADVPGVGCLVKSPPARPGAL